MMKMKMKTKVVCFFAVGVAGICLATGQTSQTRSSSAKTGSDPVKAATKPLTPKSAMPAPRKSSAAVPNTPKGGSNATTELNRLEHQPASGGTAKSTPPAKVTVPKTSTASAGNGSGINFKYQKPAGGMKATTPNPHSPNSSAPRVSK
jgi:hypothetical protein